MATQEHVDLRGEVGPITAGKKKRLLSLQKTPPIPSEYQPTRTREP